MFNGVIHRDENDVMWFDDVPVTDPSEVPRRKGWAGTRWYHTATVRPGDLAKLMGEDDSAFGPKPGRPMGYKFSCGSKGGFKVFDSRTWGVRSEDPNDTDAKLTYLHTEAQAAGLNIGASAAATALRAYMDRYDGRDGRPRLTQLAPRWRGMAHAAFHGGPIVVCRAGAENAVEIDRKSAYLDALMDDVPSVGRGDGNWVTYDGAKWDGIRDRFGFADVTVRVFRDRLGEYAIPPLSIHTMYGSVRPTGTLRGAWTISAIQEAEDRGEVEVIEVHQWACALDRKPLFRAIAEDFGALPKALGKRLYTRFWGKFASRGGFVGVKKEEGEDGDVLACGLWWKFDGIELESHKAPPHYRPDIAAFVSDHNQRRVLKVLRQIKPESVVAVHVDAIWTDDIEGADRLTAGTSEIGGWERRAEGPLRYYAAGCFNHAGRIGASGYDSEIHGPLSEEKLEKWIGNGGSSKLHMRGRLWQTDPSEDPTAKSLSVDVEMDVRMPSCEGPSVYAPIWTTNGWAKRDQAKTREPGEDLEEDDL